MASLPLEIGAGPRPLHYVQRAACSDGISIVNWRDFACAEAIAEWDDLALNASEPNSFFESWSLLPALANLDRDRSVQLVLLRINGKLVGLMPLARARSYYGYLLPHMHSWLHHNSFCGTPLVAKGHESAFWEALLAQADMQPAAALFLHLRHLPEYGPLHRALREITARQNRPIAAVHREARALLQSDQGPDAYFDASMNGKKRKELRRQHRRLSELGKLQFHRHCDRAKIDQWCTDFLRLEHAGWKGREGSALACAPATAAMFRTALHGAATRGRAEFLCLTLDEKPIAMLVNFLAPPGSFSFKTAFDEDYARFSPGVLLQRENLALLDRSDIDWSDSCAAADHPMIERIWREKRTLIHVNIGIGGRLRKSLYRLILRAELGRSWKGSSHG